MDSIYDMSRFVAMEGLGSLISKFRNGKKASKPEPASTSNTPTVYDTEYLPKLRALGYEIADMLTKSKFGTYDHMEICTKDCGWDPVDSRGSIDIAIYHWQGYDPGDKPETNASNYVEAQEKAMEIVEKEMKAIAQRYNRKAAAIHPKCSIKIMAEDVDVLYIDFDKSWVNG